MTPSAFVEVMRLIGIVFLVGAAVLLARRARTAWRLGTVLALLAGGVFLFLASRLPRIQGPAEGKAAEHTQVAPSRAARPIAKPRYAAPAADVPAAVVSPSIPIPAPAVNAPVAKAPEAPAVPVEAAAIPAGAALTVRIQDSLSTARSLPGDNFAATLEEPLLLGQHTIAEVGARVDGVVGWCRRADRNGGVSELAITLLRVESSGGRKFTLATHSYEVHGERPAEGDHGRSDLSAGIAAAVGAISGGARSRDVGIPAGSRLVFRLRMPLAVAPNQQQR